MPRPKTLESKYRHHKSSGQAYVVLDGRDVWLGEYGSVASRNKYHQVLAEWIARDRQGAPPPLTPADPAAAGPTVSMVLAAFMRHARTYYGDGGGGGELDNYRHALRPLKRLYGGQPAAAFSPLKLKAVRAEMVRDGRWSRAHANRQVGRVKAVFKWAVGEELVPAAAHHALQAVAGLRKGKGEAREAEPVRPVPEPLIDPVRPFVSEQVWAMVQLQLLTGARPGELCVLRTGDVDRSGEVWVYRPQSHKTQHHGHRREIFIGPKAQAVLSPFLKLDPQACVFSPTDAERARAGRLRDGRKSKVQPSQAKRAARARRRRRRRAPTDRYDVAAYRRAIARACDRAFPPPEPLAQRKGETAAAWRARLTPEQAAELRGWIREHRWHPHQLRHNAATRLRREYGLEAAQAILGHRTLSVTEVYAERNVAKARQVMGEAG